ncbi:MAG: DUF3047 domain-containing protein [Burkholderiales bacterium]
MTLRSIAIIALLATLCVLHGCASVSEPPAEIALPYVKLFSENEPGETLPNGWRVWTLSKFKKPTEYKLVDTEGRTAVKADAEASASGLVHKLDIDPRQYPLLSWQWKVDDLIKTADNTTKHLEDSPVRVVVSFAGDIDSLPLDDRMFFDNMRLLTRQQLPYATLMYIWENRAPRDKVLPNLHTSRIKMIVAESGRAKIGAWQDITRNVYEDYKRAFGTEPGRITAIAVMTDTDNTGENAQAWYGDIVFRRVAPPRTIFVSD